MPFEGEDLGTFIARMKEDSISKSQPNPKFTTEEMNMIETIAGTFIQIVTGLNSYKFASFYRS
jgi:hypothetical protein